MSEHACVTLKIAEFPGYLTYAMMISLQYALWGKLSYIQKQMMHMILIWTFTLIDVQVDGTPFRHMPRAWAMLEGQDVNARTQQ